MQPIRGWSTSPHQCQELGKHLIIAPLNRQSTYIYILEALSYGWKIALILALLSQKGGGRVLCCDDVHTEMSSFIRVTVSVLSIEGTDCRLDELGRLADRTGGKVR